MYNTNQHKHTAPLIKCVADPKGRKTLYELHNELLKKEMTGRHI